MPSTLNCRVRVSGLALIALVAGSASAATAAPTSATAGGSVLRSGERLTAGQQLVNSRATLTMQSDGNVVVVQEEKVVWSTRTVGHAGATLTMQTDGNLVLRGADGAAVWTTGTPVEPGAIATLDDSGALVLSSPREGNYWDNHAGAALGLNVLVSGQALRSDDEYRSSLGAPFSGLAGIGLYVAPGGGLTLWEFVGAGEGTSAALLVLGNRSGSGAPGTLTMQSDGNLVLRTLGGAATWASRTTGRGLRLIPQSDGNLVIRDTANRAVWSAGVMRVLVGAGEKVAAGRTFLARNPTWPSGRTVFGADGNLVQYDTAGRVVWSSRTAGNPGASITMQTDGNLVIRASNGRALWSTGTAGCGTGIALDTRFMTVQTSHGDVWSAARGRIRC